MDVLFRITMDEYDMESIVWRWPFGLHRTFCGRTHGDDYTPCFSVLVGERVEQVPGLSIGGQLILSGID